MTRKLRFPSAAELFLQLTLLPFLLLFGYDLLAAFGAQACSARNGDATCYPWGAEATGHIWYYATRETYILSSAIQLAVLIGALIQPFLTAEPRQDFTRTLAIAVIGMGALPVLTFML